MINFHLVGVLLFLKNNLAFIFINQVINYKLNFNFFIINYFYVIKIKLILFLFFNLLPI
jgi:hypothetical protein